MTYNGKKVYTLEDFRYEKAQIGDLVTTDVVIEAIDCLPPACMRLGCAQLGEPYSHREDTDTGKFRPTYATFKCIQGGWNEGVWEYRGHCFRGENTERGKEPVHVR